MRVAICTVGIQGSGKTTFLRSLNGEYISCDEKGSLAKYLRAIRLSKGDVLLLDRCHHNNKARDEVLRALAGNIRVYWILFEGSSKVCLERAKQRGNLKNPLLAIRMLQKHWEDLETLESQTSVNMETIESQIIRVNLELPTEQIVDFVLKEINK